MLAKVLRAVSIAHFVIAGLIATIVLSPISIERYGDRLQVALPLLAWGCAATRGDAKELFVRFGIMFTTMHSSKILLGDAAINQRPNGGDKGFPSGHTAAAVFGASALVNDCLANNPVARTIVVFSAAFVGGSRMAADKHDIWQVFAGAALAVASDRALRRESPARRRVLLAFALLGAQIGAVWRLTFARVSALLRISLRPQQATATLTAGLLSASLATPTPALAEVDLSVYGGLQTAPHSTITHSSLGSDFVRWKGRSFEMPPYYGIRATWWRNESLGFGVEFNHAKVYADDPASYGYDILEMTDGMNLLTANIWRRWLLEGPITPYVGAGVGVAIPHVEVKAVGQPATIGYQLTGPALQLVAGASYDLSEQWALFGEYKFSFSRHNISLDAGNTLSTDIMTNAINLGATLRF